MPKQILVVGDEAIVALDIRHRLESLGYEVSATVASGRDAIASVEVRKPDLILMDIQIQGDIDGIETALQIREFCDVPVIYLTANSDPATIERAKASGPLAYLLKPLDDRDLRTSIEIALNRHKQEQRIRFLEEQWEQTLGSIGDGVIATDSNGMITYMNRMAEDLVGWKLDHAKNRPIEETMHLTDEKNGDLVLNPIYEVLRRRIRVELDAFVKLTRSDGAQLSVEDSAAPIKDKTGQIIGAVLVFRDVTLKHIHELELKEYRDRLEELVDERTEALAKKTRELEAEIEVRKATEEKKRLLQEELARTERMRSIALLAGGVAHDLNNMLGPMVAYPDLALEKLPPDTPVLRYLTSIKKSAKNAAAIVQDLLTLARRGKMNLKPIELNDVVREYLSSGSFVEATKYRDDLQVEVKYAEDSPVVMGSAPHLTKAIMNLCTNAVEAMPDGGCLSMTTEITSLNSLSQSGKTVCPGEYIAFRVKDTGQGISEDDLPSIFEPYYSKKEMGKSGSGLGLAVVYGVVKDHNGYYDVLSTLGEGAEFVLYFPICNESVKEEPQRDAPLDGHATVLVVDDSEDQRNLAETLVGSLGYDVHAVANGREAVNWVKKNDADILVLDMIMEPDFDGHDTFLAVREHRPNIKAIIVSGFAATERVRLMQDKGAGEYVRKPYTKSQIGKAICVELARETASAT